MLALDGRCKTLDAAADGYVRAEAAIVIRMDPVGGPGVSSGIFDDPGDDSWLTEACVMAGSFVNQDGRSSSLTAPNGPSQQQVPDLSSALAFPDVLNQLRGLSLVKDSSIWCHRASMALQDIRIAVCRSSLGP